MNTYTTNEPRTAESGKASDALRYQMADVNESHPDVAANHDAWLERLNTILDA